MIIRHRTPSIFSIYMVDVLCCALGCVILLWQLYHAESEEQTAAARNALSKLAKADIDINDLKSERDGLKDELDSTTKEKVRVTLELDGIRDKLDREAKLALVLQSELNALRKTHRTAEALLASLKVDHAALLKKSTLTSTELAESLKAHAEVIAKAATLEKRLTALEKELNLKTLEARLSADKSDLNAKMVEDAAARAKQLEKLMAELKASGKEGLAKLSVSDLRIKLLIQQLALSQRDLSSSGKRIEELLSKQDLLTLNLLASTKDLAALKEAADRRFEGITLEGKRIIFLIDISGSMVLVDRKTPDATKWPKVVQAIERVASSLVNVESYQVVVFSSKAQYLLGDGSRWEAYDRATSPKRIGDALRELKPDGGTNLYAGLEKAFEFRKQGLDTLFVFSDGLPTEGPGLTVDDAKLTDPQQSAILARHIRTQLTDRWNYPIAGKRVRINAVGFFFESPDVGAFLWSLARENEGSFVGMSRP